VYGAILEVEPGSTGALGTEGAGADGGGIVGMLGVRPALGLAAV